MMGDGIFDDNFVGERKRGLDQVVHKVAGHPGVQREHCVYMFRFYGVNKHFKSDPVALPFNQ